MEALRGFEACADDQQALLIVLVSLELENACAVVAAAPYTFAVLLVAFVGDHVGKVREIAQVFIEVSEHAVFDVVGQCSVQLLVDV